MKIDKKTIEHIAHLARLGVSDEKLEQISSQMENVLDFADKLQDLDTSSTPPTSQVTGLHNVLREDKVKPYKDPQSLVDISGKNYEGYYMLPRVIE